MCKIWKLLICVSYHTTLFYLSYNVYGIRRYCTLPEVKKNWNWKKNTCVCIGGNPPAFLLLVLSECTLIINSQTTSWRLISCSAAMQAIAWDVFHVEFTQCCAGLWRGGGGQCVSSGVTGQHSGHVHQMHYRICLKTILINMQNLKLLCIISNKQLLQVLLQLFVFCAQFLLTSSLLENLHKDGPLCPRWQEHTACLNFLLPCGTLRFSQGSIFPGKQLCSKTDHHDALAIAWPPDSKNIHYSLPIRAGMHLLWIVKTTFVYSLKSKLWHNKAP